MNTFIYHLMFIFLRFHRTFFGDKSLGPANQENTVQPYFNDLDRIMMPLVIAYMAVPFAFLYKLVQLFCPMARDYRSEVFLFGGFFAISAAYVFICVYCDFERAKSYFERFEKESVDSRQVWDLLAILLVVISILCYFFFFKVLLFE